MRKKTEHERGHSVIEIFWNFYIFSHVQISANSASKKSYESLKIINVIFPKTSTSQIFLMASCLSLGSFDHFEKTRDRFSPKNYKKSCQKKEGEKVALAGIPTHVAALSTMHAQIHSKVCNFKIFPITEWTLWILSFGAKIQTYNTTT